MFAYGKKSRHEIIELSDDTINLMLQGKFENFKQVDDFQREKSEQNVFLHVLCKTVQKENKRVYIIETIFHNEN